MTAPNPFAPPTATVDSTEAIATHTTSIGARPTSVLIGVALLVLEAIANAVSVHVLFWLSPSSKGWVLPFQPGVWVMALLQVLLAVQVFRSANWARWLAAALTILIVGDSLLTTNWGARFQSFPAATIRDVASYSMLVTSVLLLFLPPSSAWFSHAKRDA